jgi:ethylmalonyl-CoA/methylmalonyl-CoA decarboxylase
LTKKLKMNHAVCLRNSNKYLRLFTRLFYASTISNTPLFEEDGVRAKLKPLTGQGGDVLLSYNGIENVQDTAVITIANATRKNALTGHMMVQLAEIIDELETWRSGKGIILHGAEGTFGSGADISVAKAILTPEEGAQMCFFMHRTLTRLRRLPLVSLAVVQGKAVGGGAEVVLYSSVYSMIYQYLLTPHAFNLSNKYLTKKLIFFVFNFLADNSL